MQTIVENEKTRQDKLVRHFAAMVLDMARASPSSESPVVPGHRSAWRTFDSASGSAARISAKLLVKGYSEDALIWAKAAAHLKKLQMRAIHRGY